MAPNNKPKKPTMLQRQRQLRAQQQQVRRASSNQLPASGGSSGNSRQARAQRANTTRAQAANNQRVINRGIEGFIRRGNAQDKLDKAAQGTRGSGTRTAGAGGGLARRPSSAVTPANRGQGGAATNTRVEPVRVRDVTNKPRVGGSNPARLTGGTGGADTVRGSGVRTGQPGPNRPALPASVRNAASAATRGRVGMGGLAGGTLYAAGSNLIDRYGQALGRAIRTERAVRMSSDGGRYVPGNQQRPTPAEAPKPAAKPKPPTRSSGGNPPAPGSSRRQPSSGGGSSAPSRPVSTSPSRSSSPQTSTGTAGKGRSWDEFNPNRGTSKSNNPLLDREGGYLRDRMKAREDAANKKFDTKSDVYTPNTKVDGSGLDAKKIDQKKVDEYNRRKKKFYD